jgi:hypothetical protein
MGIASLNPSYNANTYAGYSAASDITDVGTRANQPSRNAFSHALSATSCTARSAK